MIVNAIVDEPPISFADGGVIRPGVNAELDELRELSKSGRQALVRHRGARARTHRHRLAEGPVQLVFGYYLEITKANAKSVPADYERKQTLVNAERFTTPS